MKLFRVTLDDKDKENGLLAISLVDFPAVEKQFLKFKDEQPRTMLKFAEDAEQHIITGVAILADTPIYRYNDKIGEYYIVFEKDVIRQLVEKYSKDGLLNMINLQHDADTYSMDSCVMVESYFTDSARGIAPMEFADIPDGSWVVSFKVNDEGLWNKIKSSHGEEGGLNGFSIEIVSNIEEMMHEQKRESDTIDTLEDLAEAIGIEKKKIDLRISRADVKDIIYKDKQVVLTIGDDEDTFTGQIKDLGRLDGDDILNFYDVENDKWLTVALDKITKVVLTDQPLAPWNFDAPGYKDIIDNDDIVVTDSNLAQRDNIVAAIEGRYYATIFYDDESGEGCTGARTVQVCAYGYHTGTGNECFRAFQWSGATHTEDNAWKMFLTKRCRSFRLMTEAEKWETPPALYHMNDKDMDEIVAQYQDVI